MGFLLGEYVASMVGRGNQARTCFCLTVTKALRYRKLGKGSSTWCKYGIYLFWDVFVCIIPLDLHPLCLMELLLLTHLKVSYLLLANLNKSGHLILSQVYYGELSVTLDRLLTEVVTKQVEIKDLNTVSSGVFRDSHHGTLGFHQAIEGQVIFW